MPYVVATSDERSHHDDRSSRGRADCLFIEHTSLMHGLKPLFPLQALSKFAKRFCDFECMQ